MLKIYKNDNANLDFQIKKQHKHSNLSIFIPHLGCPFKCSFCDQNSISGQNEMPKIDEIEDIIKHYIIEQSKKTEKAKSEDTQIAFFGGSFTAIDFDYMIQLLTVAKKYVDEGYFSGIRISTRPDFIDKRILDILKNYSVNSIELGCQSTDNTILKLNNRGHNFEDVVSASNLIKSLGFELGLQMMIGLYGDNEEKALKTADDIISLRPDTVRIYPVVIIENTELDRLLKSGKYKPMDFSTVVDICAKLMIWFEREDIKIIKLGLHSSETLEKHITGGFYHPALRELCESKVFYDIILAELLHMGCYGKNATCLIPRGCLSKAIGQKKSNKIKLQNLGFMISFRESSNLIGYEVKIIVN